METGVNIAPGHPQVQSTAHQTFRRLLGRSTARKAFCFFGYTCGGVLGTAVPRNLLGNRKEH